MHRADPTFLQVIPPPSKDTTVYRISLGCIHSEPGTTGCHTQTGQTSEYPAAHTLPYTPTKLEDPHITGDDWKQWDREGQKTMQGLQCRSTTTQVHRLA